MLVLSRKVGEKIVIGDGIVVTVLELKGKGVRLGIQADATVPVWRGELVEFHDREPIENRELQLVAAH